jgi:hypothetical protein
MDSASTGDDRLREIIDRLLVSPAASARDRLLLEEAKALLAPPARPAITIRHDPRTVPEPAVVSLTMPGGDR